MRAKEFDPSPKHKRPRLVWAIFIFYVFSVATTLLSFSLIRQGKVVLPPAEASIWAEMGAFDFVWSLLIGALGLYAAICLFQLRSIAARLFLILLIIQIVTSIWYAFTTNWGNFLFTHPSRAIAALLVWALAFAFWYYADRLKRCGVLT